MNISEKLLIVGAGGHGKVVADIALKMKRWECINFLDDNLTLDTFPGMNIIGQSDEAVSYIKDYDIIIAIGQNNIREKIQNKIEKEGGNIPTLIHPSAIIGEKVTIGKGTVIMAGVIINSFSNIGRGVIINTGATIDHDNYIYDYVHISPGVHTAGEVKIRKNTWVCIGATISNNLYIAEDSVIGAGAVVINNITDKGTYIGVPARRSEKME